MMIKKIKTYLISGGIDEVISYALTYIRKVFYYKSETIFLYLEKGNIEIPKSSRDISFNIYNKSTELKKLNFDRIKTLSYKQWFEQGSQAIIGFYETKPVSFTWSHFNNYKIHSINDINLSNNKCWIGPTFVDKSMGGKGLNKAQIVYQLNNIPNCITYCLTSANSKNIASIKSFERLGFKKGLIITKNYGMFSKHNTKMSFKNNGNEIFKLQ